MENRAPRAGESLRVRAKGSPGIHSRGRKVSEKTLPDRVH